MSATTLARARLRSQLLTAPAGSPLQAVEQLGALQAQDYAWAIWAVGLRVEPRTGLATQRAVEEAINSARIIRTWPMRRTMHLVAAADVRWMLALMGARALAVAEPRRRALGIDDAHLHQAGDLWAAALQGGKRLRRSAMLQALERGGVPTDGQRGYHILVHWAMRGRLCLGPNAGKEQTYVLLDEWAAPASPLERDEALATLALRFFRGHGPATLQDFAWWSGLPMGDVRAALSAAAPNLQRLALGERDYWMAPGTLDEGAGASGARTAQFHLAAGFDEMLLGYRDREAVISPANAERIVPGGNGVFKPVVLRDGYVVGGWQRTARKKGVTIVVESFAEPGQLADDATQRGLAEAALRYGDFVGAPTTLSLIDTSD